MNAEVLKFAPTDVARSIVASRNAPNRILDLVSGEIAAALAASNVSPQLAQTLEERVATLSGVLAGAQRIKSTPLPYAYSLPLHRTAYLFCFLLPFGLVDTTGIWTPLLASPCLFIHC